MMNKEETTFKIRTDKQLERLNYLLCFKSKSAIAEILIDAEEIIDKAIQFIEEHNKNAGKLYYKYNNKYLLSEIKEDLLEILGGKE